MGRRNSRLTALFEALVIDWLNVATISEVARRLNLGWSSVARGQERAAKRGLDRREQAFPDAIGIDETAFQRRHEYVTVVKGGERLLHVADGAAGRWSMTGTARSLQPCSTGSGQW